MKKDERKLCLNELLAEQKGNQLFNVNFDKLKKTITIIK